MDIPGHLEAQIRDGKAVLFVGAGGSMEAKDKNGARPPNAGEFAAMLSERFLGGKYKGLPLAEVSEYAISEADLVTVQEFIREMFEGFEPSTAHQLIPSFNWWGLATTNFDRLIEKAYEQSSNPVQLARPFIENGDRVEDHMRDPRSVMLLKLHGCITRTSNTRCPLILTPDQYVLHRQGRSRLFDHLRGWSFERPIVFVGHRLQDSDLRTILLELTNTTDSRPRFYAVLPEVDPIQQRLWEAKKVTLLQGKLVDFLTSLDSRIPRTARVVTADSERPQLAIAARFKKTDATLSEGCLQFLRTDVDYVGDISATRMIAPADFYKGMNAGWAPIEQELDVRRQLGDTILADHVLIPESGHPRGPEFILVKAHAGAGKSVLLRRIAWDASKDYGALCLFLKPHGVINSAALQELITACQERVYLFVDEGADRVRELEGLASNIGPEGDRLTVVLAERINEWNIAAGGELSSLMSATYELRYLSPREIDTLLGLLEKHRALGTLERASIDARRAAFVDRAGRQLLVALHEATLGKPFEEIIENEFKNVRPVEAQRMYLSICVLNRLNVPVRAGIIARIHDVHFEEFKEKFFGPLEQVVYADYDPIIRDYMYRARHPHIADIVFQKVLRNQEERFDVYVRCLKELNIDYSADSRAFRQMIRGRTVLDLFPDHELARRVYDVARERVGEEAHLLHQMGLYEMNRANGSLIQTADLLARAAVLAPWDLSIKHSMAEERLKSAEIARTSLQKESLLREAAEI